MKSSREQQAPPSQSKSLLSEELMGKLVRRTDPPTNPNRAALPLPPVEDTASSAPAEQARFAIGGLTAGHLLFSSSPKRPPADSERTPRLRDETFPSRPGRK